MTTSASLTWEALEEKAATVSGPTERLYTALGVSAVGVRAAYLPGKGTRELLVEVPTGWSAEPVLPEWRGLEYAVIDLSLAPRRDARHLRLASASTDHHDVFGLLADDLVASLEGVTSAPLRVEALERCLLRWRRFFDRTGPEGLTSGQQQGLFAELVWLQHLLEAGVRPERVVASWKGAERGYHDFDLEGEVVEVKSTRTKEPRGVTVNNERQLDDRGLQSLHLYVLSLHEVDGGGESLPERVSAVRSALSAAPAALAALEHALVSAGYLDRDAARYTARRLIRHEDLYRVSEGFPRIVGVPPGVGGLQYRVTLGSCEPFRADPAALLSRLAESQ